MTQTITRQSKLLTAKSYSVREILTNRPAKASQDVKVNLKRKDTSIDSNNMEDISKKQKSSCTVRSRINANKDFWKDIPILKSDCRTAGLIPRLEPNFKRGDTQSAYLCSPLTDHLSTGFMDLGWGCGYRNCQMLMTFLERHKEEGEPLLKHVLDIAGIQLLIEKAWKEGFDTLGAAQLDHRVFKTRKWIGTTEVYTLLTYLGIRSTIIDFHRPGPNNLHHELMDWIQAYFTDATQQKSSKTVYITNRPPLYLQHQGHSRTVVGIEVLKSGKRNLIMFDPGRRILRSYRSSQSVEEQPVEEEEDNEEEEVDIVNHDDENDENSNTPSLRKRFMARLKHNPLPSSLLRPFRVDDKTIGKHKQYQVLALGHVNYENGKMTWDDSMGYLLDKDEQERMKNVTSLAVM